MIKKIFILFVLASMTSCSSDDDNQQTNESSILDGDWFFLRQDSTSCTNEDGFLQGGESPTPFYFLSDNTVSFENTGSLTLSSYTLNGNNLNIEMLFVTQVRAYQFSGNYTYSESLQSFSGNFTHTAHDGMTTDDEILWSCEGPTQITK